MPGDSSAASNLVSLEEARRRGRPPSGGSGDGGGVPLELRELPLSDVWNAKLFAHLWRETTRYNHETKQWVIYQEGRWQNDITGEKDRRLVETIERIRSRQGIAALSLIANKSEGDLNKHYLSCLDAKRISAAERLARSECFCTSDQFDTDRMLLNVENGVLDLRTGKFRPPTPDDMLMKRAPVSYDPEATAPQFQKAIEYSMAGDEQMTAFLWRTAGLWLTGDVSESAFFVFYGSGQNGKGTFISTLTALLGFDYTVFLPVQYFLSSKFQDSAMPIDVHAAKGKRLVVVSENERNARFNTAKIKLWTGGGDVVTGKGMRENLSQNLPTFKLVLQTNNYPQFNDNSKAFKRRLRVLPFRVQIPDDMVDPKLKDYLRDNELPGILNLALNGLAEWRALMEETHDGLSAPDVVKKASSDMLAMQDVLAEFVQDYVVLTENLLDRAKRSELYEAYERSCAANHDKPMTSRSFIAAMRDQEGFVQRELTSGSWRGWHGMKIANQEHEAASTPESRRSCKQCPRYAVAGSELCELCSQQQQSIQELL